jgi:ribosomal protein S18 acetylase RimI-like enzyme
VNDISLFTDDLGPIREQYLELMYSASSHFDQFVYGSAVSARRANDCLFDLGFAEYSPPAGRALLVNGAVAGVFAVLTFDLLRKRRLQASLAMARNPDAFGDAQIARRRRLAASTLGTVTPSDTYLARIAASPPFTGRGIGLQLLAQALLEAGNTGAQRCVLDVAEDNRRAVKFYIRAGFSELGRSTTSDPETGRLFSQVQMGLSLTRWQ